MGKLKIMRFFLLAAILLLARFANAQADYTATVNPGSVVVSNFLGWGTSLCWWANVVGG
jgi:galactan endo-1,6-beta-galactosidase